MAANEIHKGNIGTAFTVTIKESGLPLDISGTTSRSITFMKPEDGSLSVKSATLVGGGSGGLMQYVTVSGDLNQCGTWYLQGFVYFNTNDSHYSDKASFKVHGNLGD